MAYQEFNSSFFILDTHEFGLQLVPKLIFSNLEKCGCVSKYKCCLTIAADNAAVFEFLIDTPVSIIGK